MTREELTKIYASRILEAQNPKKEVETITEELRDLVSDEDVEVTQKDRDFIINEVRFMVNDEMNRSEDTRELDEDAIIEALDLLERGEV